MSVVDLKSVAAAGACKMNNVVSFKDARNGNVVLCTGGIYIYTLRATPKELRVVNVANGNSRDLYKEHTSIPTVAKVISVGIKQHMIASGSDSELLVWSVQGQGCTTFFRWSGVKIIALEWVKSQDGTHPTLAVIYSIGGGAQKLGVINTKKVMDRYAKAGLDAKAVDILADDVNEPSLAVNGCNLLAASSVADAKAIAVASTSASVVDVVFNDNSTSKVTLPGAETISAVFVNSDLFLVVIGAKGTVSVFNLIAKEAVPTSVLNLRLPAAPATSAALGTVVSVLSENALYSLQLTAKGAKIRAVSGLDAVQSFTLVEDGAVIRGVFDSEKFINTGVVFDLKNAVDVPMDVASAAPPAYTSSPAARPAQPAISLKNSTLASVAAPASITAAQSVASADVDAAIEDLRVQVGATHSAIVAYGDKARAADLQKVIQTALEAQMSELLKLRIPSSSGAAGASSASSLDDAFLSTFRTELITNISSGITAAVDQVAESVEAKIRDAGRKNTKKAGSEALKRKLDAFVGEANSTFANALSDRMKNGDSNFKHSVAHLNRANDEAVRILQQQVDDLNGQLRAIANSGIVEEVRRLRKEVATLKLHAASNVQAAPVSPDTLIQTAIATIDAGNVAGGFEYAAATGQPAVVSAVLVGVKDQVFESTALSNELWSAVLTLGSIGADSKDAAIALLHASEVIKDDESILSVNASKARVALKAFVSNWKSAFATEAPLRNQLKSLEVEINHSK